ncbi:MAG: ABC transporter permease [Chloroflexi bacterium]|nr:MAG: ABC transporter permease [Chloroflexota bacterium]TMG36868.1 MAG: ABC transporter permease [Chloroflexota bacterium]
MNRARQLLWNPIVSKEYRSRMRTWRSPLAMTLYILLLGGLGWAVFSSLASAAQSGFSGQAANYGQQLFLWLTLFQALLLTFIVPALTAGAISGERERQTIDLLFVTQIPPFSIIWGKLLASMSFVIILLLLSVPIFSLVFLFGGIEIDQVLTAFLVCATTALTLGVLGILFSTAARRTLPSTVAAYVGAFLLVAGSMLWGQLFPTTIDPASTKAPAPPAVSYLSPILPLITIANQPVSSYGIRNGNVPMNSGGFSSGSAQVICKAGPAGNSCVTVSGPNVVSGAGVVSPPATVSTIPSGPFAGWQFWQATVVLQLVVVVIALIVSGLLLPPVRRLPWRKRAAPAAA